MEYVLRERTVIITGPFNTLTQSLMMGLTNQGADVALIDVEAKKAERFCSQLTDQREVHAKHGRAAAFQADVSKFMDLKDAIGKVVQSFGGIDVLIDTQMTANPTPVTFEGQEYDFASIIDSTLKGTLQVTQSIMGFLTHRKKGRVIYMMPEALQRSLPQDAVQAATRTGLIAFAKCLAKQVQEHNVTINVLQLGPTEEYLLGHYPGATVKEALEKYRAIDSYARIVEPDKVTQSIVFLSSNSGAAVNGQVISLT